MGYLTDADREALVDAFQDGVLMSDGTSTDLTQLGIVVERIVRCHRAEALREAAGDVAYGVDWAAAPESVEEWLHDWADQIEADDE